MMSKLSVIIPCYNEEDSIGRALDSVSWADEIILLDSYSTDQSRSIAEAKGARIIEREFDYPARQKNWAIPQASHDWILLLDSDEEITPELKEEIRQILESDPKHKAYWIPRKNIFMDQQVNFGDWKRDAVIRLIHKEHCRYGDIRVHEEIETRESIGRLSQVIKHYTYKGLHHYLKKLDRYTNWGAHDRFDRGKRVGMAQMMLKPLWSFIRAYFIRLGILDGRVGFILAYLAAYTAFIRTVKIWRLQKAEPVPKD